MKKEFDNGPIYNRKLMKNKIKSYGNEATDFYDKEILKAVSNYTGLALINFGLKKRRKLTSASGFKDVNTLKKKKKVIRHITEEQEFSSDHSDESDEE